MVIKGLRTAQASLKEVAQVETKPTSAKGAARLKLVVLRPIVCAGHKVTPPIPKARLAASASASFCGAEGSVLSLRPAKAAMVVADEYVAEIAELDSCRNAAGLATPRLGSPLAVGPSAYPAPEGTTVGQIQTEKLAIAVDTDTAQVAG